ncbi:DUF6220 domain-containing protein [Cohnella nanjingensis]|uniref:Uncharacterized protein n=1 Tax=Cohnella nanjingensis TaxID=1387779 RepID=A0A7X0RZG4_9BACL|nr:DUF6220 domain-containing protein [Cohnella nanjingensis]MBB6674914.1 hypothetical protein [Cohnella nanjingensis]
MGSAKPSAEGNRYVRVLYAFLAVVTFVCIVIQVFLAGLGTFAGSENWAMHAKFVNYFEFAPPIMFLLSFGGRIRGTLRWIPLALFLLISFQHMSVRVFSDIGWLAAFHTIAALLLFWGAMHTANRSKAWLLPRLTDSPAGKLQA